MFWVVLSSIITIFILFPILFGIYIGWITLLPVSHWEISAFSYFHDAFMKLLSLTNATRNFPVKFVNKGAIDTNGQYLYALHPHGMITLSKLLHFSDKNSPLYPYWKNSRHAAHSTLFMIPGIREAGLLFNSIPVGKSYLQYYIDKGDSITLYPGGAKEIQYSEENLKQDFVYLKNRKGFIKLCKENALKIIPVYGWNEQSIFTYKSHFEPLNKIVSKMIGFTVNFDILQMFTIENIYKFLKVLMGEKEPNTTLYVGEPFTFEEGETIEAAHERYIGGLRELYEYARKDQGSERMLVVD